MQYILPEGPMQNVALGDRVKGSDICKDLGIERLVLSTDRSQVWWFEYLIRMPPGQLPLQVFREHLIKRRPWGRP